MKSPVSRNEVISNRWRGLKLWQRVSIMVVLALLLAAGFIHRCVRNPGVRFLPGHRGASWVIFPSAVDTSAHPVAYLDTKFRRSFELQTQPGVAHLKVYAFKRFQLKINGAPVETAKIDNWKDPSSVDVRPFLRPGQNVIEVRVFNDKAPPALWLRLRIDQKTVATDEQWEASIAGSTWRAVVDASTPRFPGPGNPIVTDEHTIKAVRQIWPVWAAFAAIATLILSIARTRLGTSLLPENRRELVLVILFAALWAVLFWNNGNFLTRYGGFDARSHLDYVKYMQERRAVPLPAEGFEMSHPPLYYALSAAALSVCGLTVDDIAGIHVLRWLTMSIGIAHFVFVFLSLRLIFPTQAPRLVGLLVAAFLPMQLYLSHYVTNETLTATLMAGALYFSLRALKSANGSLPVLVWLGTFLGTALLTKVTAVLLLPPLLVALASKLLAERSSLARWLCTLGIPFALCSLVSGWYYLWIWRRLGTPLAGNWDPAVGGLAWWQDPGYLTAANFFRFGRSLIRPFFSGFVGIPDGIYSTLWGDGLWGGLSDVASQTPWNYRLMTGGYLLAVLPAIMIIVGLTSASYKFIRAPSLEYLLLFGFCAIVSYGFFRTTLAGSYAQIKAFYGSSALTPLCCFAAIGWDTLTRRAKSLQFIIGALLLIWAMNSFASMWVRESARQHVYNAARWQFEGNFNAASSEALKAIELEPTNEMPHRFLSVVALQSQQINQALEQAAEATRLAPFSSDTHMQLSAVLMRQGEFELAAAEAQRALKLGAENALAYDILFAAYRI